MRPISILSRIAARGPWAGRSVAGLAAALAVAALLLSAAGAWPQATPKPKPPAADPLAGYRVGQWVRVEGMTRGGAASLAQAGSAVMRSAPARAAMPRQRPDVRRRSEWTGCGRVGCTILQSPAVTCLAAAVRAFVM